jgi:cytoskeletal protein CcmA (bactofilin family)
MIGPSIEIRGDLSGGEDLHVEGRVEGKIELRRHNVSIGKSGRVQADIFGKVITVDGEVQGNLFGEEQIILRHSSTVRGNLTAPRVMLEDGSNFKGSIDMTPKESAGATGPQAKPPAVVPKPTPTAGGVVPQVAGPKTGA